MSDIFDSLDMDAEVAALMSSLDDDPHADGERTHKQALIMLDSLGMSRGKLVAQGAHASLKALLDQGSIQTDSDGSRFLKMPLNDHIGPWLESAFTKIALTVSTERELVEAYLKARFLGLPCALIRDNGHTEFNGVKTLTAVSIGPARMDLVDKITTGLPTLKDKKKPLEQAPARAFKPLPLS